MPIQTPEYYCAKPHWTVTHKIFKESSPATYDDVLKAYGTEMIQERIADAVKGDVRHLADRCIWFGDLPMSEEKAKVKIWDHLKNTIDEQRTLNAKRRARIPALKNINSDYPDPWNTNQAARDSYDEIGR